MTPSEVKAKTIVYLKGEVEKLRARLQKANEDYASAVRRQREHTKNLAALEGVLKMVEREDAAPPSLHE